MIKFKNIATLIYKQAKEILKNMHILILFIVFPIIGIIMSQAMDVPGFSISIFAVMHCVLVPLSAVSVIMAEEKEKNTLRMLIMSGVSALEYMLSVGIFILGAVMVTAIPFIILLPESTGKFILSLAVGTVISIILGMCIGSSVKSTAAANGVSVPVGMLLSFMPMLSNFNDTIYEVSKFTYGQQISNLMAGKTADIFSLTVIGVNLLIFILLFSISYRKNRLA